jgi:(R,R)-butanediol dehydrogenase/meso-butanediol dehydrogenase/diacetyl reductase
MRALAWNGRAAVLCEVARPRPESGRVVIDTAYVGICGTDLHIVDGSHPRAKPGLVLGHEVVGRIADSRGGYPPGTPVLVNPLISDGTCAACRDGLEHLCDNLGLFGIDAPGGLAEQLSVPAEAVVPLPPGLDLRRAGVIEPVAVGVRAVRRSGLRLGQRVHVIGAGPIGLVVAACARLAGAGEITVSEPAPYRAQAARTAGYQVVDSGDAALRHRAQVVFDCTGHPAVSPTCSWWAATGGTIVTCGVYPGVSGVDLQDLLFRELHLIGTRVYTPSDIDTAVRLVADGRFDADALVTAVVPLADGAAAIDRLRGGQELKVLIQGPAA